MCQRMFVKEDRVFPGVYQLLIEHTKSDTHKVCPKAIVYDQMCQCSIAKCEYSIDQICLFSSFYPQSQIWRLQPAVPGRLFLSLRPPSTPTNIFITHRSHPSTHNPQSTGIITPFKRYQLLLSYLPSALDRRTRIRPPWLDTSSPSLVVLLPPRLVNILRVKTKFCRQDEHHPYVCKSSTNVCDLSMIIIRTQPFCPMQETSGRLRRECR